jgi:predicted Zn-dependent protease
MSNIVRKLTSRKLWLAIAGIATGVALALGADTSEVSTIAGAVTAIVSVITYIITEGKIDAAGVKTAVEATQDAIGTITTTEPANVTTGTGTTIAGFGQNGVK